MLPSLGLRGLYAITPQSLCADTRTLSAAVEAALRGGAVLIQYRDKAGTAGQRRANAQALLALCRDAGAGLILNDDLDLAESVGAHGVHLGTSDADIGDARRVLGEAALIGATCGSDLRRAETAAAAGASYIAFGRFFDSVTKPQAAAAEISVLTLAKQRFALPICAIGGVTPDNGGVLIDAGADLLAAVNGVFGDHSPDAVEAAARAYAKLFG